MPYFGFPLHSPAVAKKRVNLEPPGTDPNPFLLKWGWVWACHLKVWTNLTQLIYSLIVNSNMPTATVDMQQVTQDSCFRLASIGFTAGECDHFWGISLFYNLGSRQYLALQRFHPPTYLPTFPQSHRRPPFISEIYKQSVFGQPGYNSSSLLHAANCKLNFFYQIHYIDPPKVAESTMLQIVAYQLLPLVIMVQSESFVFIFHSLAQGLKELTSHSPHNSSRENVLEVH
jgi:hypothetical protein